MSTLDGPIWSKCSTVLTCPGRSHFQHTLSKKRWGQGWDERHCSSGKEEEEEKKTSKRRTEEEKKRKQATDFEGAACCPSAVVQGGSIAKKQRGAPGVTGTFGKANNHFDPTQTGSGTTPPR